MRALILSVVVTVAASCTTLKQLIGVTTNPPTVELTDARLAGADFSELTFDLVLEIDNRNSVDLAFRNLDYKAYVFDTLLTSGLFEKRVVAKANARTRFEIPLKVALAQVADIAEKLLSRGLDEALLRLEAEASFVTDAGEITVDFSDERTLGK